MYSPRLFSFRSGLIGSGLRAKVRHPCSELGRNPIPLWAQAFRLGSDRELTMNIDRSEVSRAVAKAIAYKACGKDKEANEWARKLVELLQCADILR